jgi:hypothetical protein
LVIRAPKTDTTTSASASSTTTSAASDTQPSANHQNVAQPNVGGFPFGLGLGQVPGMGNLNFANTNFHDMQQQFQQQVN